MEIAHLLTPNSVDRQAARDQQEAGPAGPGQARRRHHRPAGAGHLLDLDEARAPRHHRRRQRHRHSARQAGRRSTASTACSPASSSPIDFDAIDDRPVDLIFLLLAPEASGADHLKALARVSRLLRDKTACEKLRGTDDTEALYALLVDTTASWAA